MSLKMKSLSIKLTVLFVLSILVVVSLSMGLTEYRRNQIDTWAALRESEKGPALINGVKPGEIDTSHLFNNPEYSLDSRDIQNELPDFKPVLGIVKGLSNISSSIDGPFWFYNEEYFSITYDVTETNSGSSYIIGLFLISKNLFPATIAAFSDPNLGTKRLNQLYYRIVPEYDNMVFLVSMNNNVFPVKDWVDAFLSDIKSALPIVFIGSVIFGMLTSLIATVPLTKITSATERLSHSDMKSRVNFKSVDEIGRLARSFNTMADRLENSFNTQKLFVSDAAHELRTPLASMKALITTELASPRECMEKQELLSFLLARVKDLEGIVNDLLFLSRVDEGKFNLSMGTFDLSATVTESEEAFRYLFEAKGIRFVSQVEPGLSIRGERKMMLRVLSNLLDNAGKNTPTGGTISLTATRSGADIVISVADNGPGISSENIAHVFERFYRLPGQQEGSGYGLGLAIAKSIINAANGQISLRSEKGHGSTFLVQLPQCPSL
jgi:two-component system, OmpR family, heavy metal sensor histidine kinase CusS